MVDAVHLLEQRPQFGAVVHVAAREVDIRVEHLWVAGGEVVQAAHHVAFAGKLVGKMRTEESGCAGDEEIHA